MGDLRTKRAYQPASRSDGKRVLVDALWPRGLSRERLQLDHWWKDLAPSAGLRRWYAHEPGRWPEFCRRYADELAANEDAVERLRDLLAEGTVTLIYAARDEARNNALALKAYIEAHRMADRPR